MCQAEFLVVAHRIEDDFEALALYGRVSDAEEDRFHDEYATSIIAATDIPDL